MIDYCKGVSEVEWRLGSGVIFVARFKGATLKVRQ